jgi:hypothetical protein
MPPEAVATRSDKPSSRRRRPRPEFQTRDSSETGSEQCYLFRSYRLFAAHDKAVVFTLEASDRISMLLSGMEAVASSPHGTSCICGVNQNARFYALAPLMPPAEPNPVHVRHRANGQAVFRVEGLCRTFMGSEM